MCALRHYSFSPNKTVCLAQAELSLWATEPSPRTCPAASRVAVGKSPVLGPEIPAARLRPGRAPTAPPLTCPSPLKTRRGESVVLRSQDCVGVLLPMQIEHGKARVGQKPALGAFEIRFLDRAGSMWSNPWSHRSNRAAGSLPQLQERSSGSFI